MKTKTIALLLAVSVSFGCSTEEIKNESTAVMVTTSLNGIPLLYLREQVSINSLQGIALSEVRDSFDPKKLKTNDKNLKKDASSYYLVSPDRKFIKIEIEDGVVLSAEDHGLNGTSLLMNAMMKELNENKSVLTTPEAAPPAS